MNEIPEEKIQELINKYGKIIKVSKDKEKRKYEESQKKYNEHLRYAKMIEESQKKLRKEQRERAEKLMLELENKERQISYSRMEVLTTMNKRLSNKRKLKFIKPLRRIDPIKIEREIQRKKNRIFRENEERLFKEKVQKIRRKTEMKMNELQKTDWKDFNVIAVLRAKRNWSVSNEISEEN